jgi:hypothetical protein
MGLLMGAYFLVTLAKLGDFQLLDTFLLGTALVLRRFAGFIRFFTGGCRLFTLLLLGSADG